MEMMVSSTPLLPFQRGALKESWEFVRDKSLHRSQKNSLRIGTRHGEVRHPKKGDLQSSTRDAFGTFNSISENEMSVFISVQPWKIPSLDASNLHSVSSEAIQPMSPWAPTNPHHLVRLLG
jgi:hypothetical protein